MRPALRMVAASALLALASCTSVSHFTDPPSRYDGLFFGQRADSSSRLAVEDSTWRIYAIYGLVPWSRSTTEFAGGRLSRVPGEERPLRIAVETKYSFLNGLSAGGVNMLVGPFGALLFVPRTTRVEGWRDEPTATADLSPEEQRETGS